MTNAIRATSRGLRLNLETPLQACHCRLRRAKERLATVRSSSDTEPGQGGWNWLAENVMPLAGSFIGRQYTEYLSMAKSKFQD